MSGALALLLFAACGKTDVTDTQEMAKGNNGYEGIYHGVSWKGASKGTTLEDTDQKIDTFITLDENGIITDVKMDFLALKGGEWKARNNSEAEVAIDYTVDPQAAVAGSNYEKGTSMFDIKTNDMMSLYALGVDTDGTVAVAVVDAVIRYKLEMKLEPGFDFDTKLEQVTINNELIPTVRTSGSGLVKPADWSELEGRDLYDIHPWNHVMSDRGVLEGIDETSTVGEMLVALGVEFKDGVPVEMAPVHGFHSNGGWEGNYKAIAEYLKGKDAKEVTSLIDWSVSKYANGINEGNYFGVDTPAGATRTAQNSVEGMAGATVRLSRENTSYQAALVQAGIISEDEVVKGRF